MDPTDAPVWGPASGHILINCEYARLIRSLFRRAALSSSLLVPVENIIFLSGPASDKYDIVQPDHDKEKGAAQGRLPEPEAKQRTNKCQPIQILLSVPKRVCNTN